MKILKVLCHIEVDRMLYGALGDDLTILRHEDPTGWIKDEDLNIPVTHDLKAVAATDWDVIIYDDTRTWGTLERLNLKCKHKVWYVHGTYHTWKDFQDFANRELTDFHFLFTDRSRIDYWSRWFKNKPLSTLVLPILFHTFNDQIIVINVIWC